MPSSGAVPLVIWLPEALRDVERLHDFLKEKSPQAERRAAQTILQGAELLEGSPEAGRPLSGGTGRRELFLPFGAGFYVLRYRRDTTGTVVVIRVWHSRENRE